MILDQSDGWKTKGEGSELFSMSPNVEVEMEIVERDPKADPIHFNEEKEGAGLVEPIEDGEILTITTDSSNPNLMATDETSIRGPGVERVQEDSDSRDGVND